MLMRPLWIILALMPMLILGASGISRSNTCQMGAPACTIEVAVQLPIEEPSCCSGFEAVQETEEPTQFDGCSMDTEQVGMARCCCKAPVPLSDLIFCCLTPLSSVPPTSQNVLLKPTMAGFVLPMWEDSPRVFVLRHFKTPPVVASTGPPPSRPCLCIWVI